MQHRNSNACGGKRRAPQTAELLLLLLLLLRIVDVANDAAMFDVFLRISGDN
jgi:hypothetical protein